MTEDRAFRPSARYAALRNPGPRWHDDRTGQEHWRRVVGVDTLHAAGATLDDPRAVRLPCYVEIGPYLGPGGDWVAKVSRRWLDVREEDGVVRSVSTASSQATQTFDDRQQAVEWAAGEVEPFGSAEVRDAAEWHEARKAERDEERQKAEATA